MLAFIRRYQKPISIFLLINFLMSTVDNDAFALTSGPAQPEMQQFAPAGMGDMVDPGTGDFSYNIPLMDVGGYPINLNYASGITPDAEASWVGLGWNLNVGAINRSVRGLPDDFAGEEISKEINIKPNQTFGLTGDIDFEIFGFQTGNFTGGLGLSASLFYNNYNGLGMSMGVSPSLSAGIGSSFALNANMGLAATLNSESGVDVNPSVGLSAKIKGEEDDLKLSTTYGYAFNSKEGLKGRSLSASYGVNKRESVKEKDGSMGTREYNAFSGNRGVFQGFAAPTYTPALDHNMFNVNVSTKFTFGSTNPANEIPAIGFGAYYSGQFVTDKKRSTPAYGYMYSGLSQSEDKILDFNREKESSYNKHTTNLPVTNFTYDIFSVSGQGIGGTYRLFRGDVGAVHDPVANGTAVSPSVGVEVGVGPPPSAKVGLDLTFNFSSSTSGKWQEERHKGINDFSSEATTGIDEPNKEAVYFKRIGELTPEGDLDFLNNVQYGYSPIRHSVTPAGGGLLNNHYEIPGNNSPQAIPADNQRSVRRLRENQFTALTVNETAENYGVLPIQSYNYNDFTWNEKENQNVGPGMANYLIGYSKEYLPRRSESKKGHHISEARITDPSGSRYVYGIPVYNNVQEEVTFSVNGGDPATGLAAYSGKDATPDNENGFDNYFNKVVTPSYATSYLLTSVLSADYMDSDGVLGPSDGDQGSYTKFNYTKAIETYRWRTPFAEGHASYSEGMIGDPSDDRGNYVYGEKEVWYLHSIETRTHVAEFYLKDREDGLGVVDQNGKLDSDTKLKRLDKIVLYSKRDKWNTNPTPVKTVHFSYDYSLCPGTPNSIAAPIAGISGSGNGKLTLRKVWFTYGHSQKGILNPYVFNYADENFDGVMETHLNPRYNIKSYDRWGNYKGENLNGLSLEEFPYSIQDTTTADQNAAVWALNSIQTPTGGTLRVYYESDDYAYVQNRQAMRMFQVLGTAANSTSTNPDNDLFNHSFLVIDLAEGFKPVNGGQKNAEFREKYLKDIEMMYYKMKLNVVSGNQGTSLREEYVPGYASIDIENSLLDENSGDASGYYKKAFIKLKFVDSKDGKIDQGDLVNPIARSGWMFARIQLGRELAGKSFNAGDGALTQVAEMLIGMIKEAQAFATGFISKMKSEGHSRLIADRENKKSFVRLNEPDKIKLGGGHRVKALVMVDNWEQMVSTKESDQSLPVKETSYYGQSYDYTFREENGTLISAGVAAYEPILGGEENPFRKPIFVREKVPMAPDKEYYMEEPFGESFFPSPNVSYRKVKITPLKITSSNDLANEVFKGNGTGYAEHEYYTAYDFPSITKQTDLKAVPLQPSLVAKFMKFELTDVVTCSQGYSIELNDMHGRLKSQRIFPEPSATSGNTSAEANKPISEIVYRYKINENGTLNNDVTYVNQDLSIVRSGQGSPMGVDVDVVQDERYSYTSTIGGGAQFNLKYIQAALIPLFFPMLYPDFNMEETKFRSIVTTKVVNKYGILESISQTDNGATSTVTNLAWDSKTGQVVLTSADNEFHDLVYKFTYPAHWAYPQMDLASQNEGMVFTDVNNVLPYLKPGDEILGEATSDWGGNNNLSKWETIYFWDDSMGVTKELINWSGGDVVDVHGKLKVVRSGSKNMIDRTVGTIVCLDNPIKPENSSVKFTGIIDAEMDEYNDVWRVDCSCGGYGYFSYDNEFVLGHKGAPRHLRNWTYLTERTQSRVNDNLHVRKDGQFADFTEFWKYNQATGYLSPLANPNSSKWQDVITNTLYNTDGMVIENRDALYRYSTIQYNHGSNVPSFISINSQREESGYEGFEDEVFWDHCGKDFRFYRSGAKISMEEAHTGRNSIKLGTPQNYAYFSFYYNIDLTYEGVPPQCIPSLMMVPGKKYLISAWVKEGYDQTPSTYTHSGIQVNFESNNTQTSLPLMRPSGPIIDGWQRIEGVITGPSYFTPVDIKLVNDNAPVPVYFDDIRLHPFEADMKSFVYNPFTLKLAAELDENNYFTAYEYDDEGILVRVKKETERGVMTIKETRTNQSKINKP